MISDPRYKAAYSGFVSTKYQTSLASPKSFANKSNYMWLIVLANEDSFIPI